MLSSLIMNESHSKGEINSEASSASKDSLFEDRAQLVARPTVKLCAESAQSE